VRAESAGEAKGSTFVISLPLATVTRADVMKPAPPLARGDGEDCAVPGVDLTGVTVLVIDDDDDTRRLLRTLLESCGAEVVTAAGVAEAMAAIERARPSVVLSDIEMPGEDGYDFIRRLRALPAERGGRLPAAALTAYARSEDRRRALQAGFQLHAAKPIEPVELLTILANLAGRQA
jgi:CheY-like chemotaxis protein